MKICWVGLKGLECRVADAVFSFFFSFSIFAAAGARMCKNSLCSCSRWRFFFVDKFWLKPKVLLGQGGLEMDYDAPFFL